MHAKRAHGVAEARHGKGPCGYERLTREEVAYQVEAPVGEVELGREELVPVVAVEAMEYGEACEFEQLGRKLERALCRHAHGRCVLQLAEAVLGRLVALREASAGAQVAPR